MPSYEYYCEIFDKEFEEFHSITIKLEDCPLCREAGIEPHAPKRLISGGSGRGIVELTGHELKAHITAEGEKIKREVYRDENKLSNIVGPSKFHQQELQRTKR